MATAVGWAPIIKSEKTADGTLRVTGKAADSSLDRDFQIADPAWLDKAMGAWYSEPDGGNVREQHDGKRAVGTAIEYRKGDDGGHYITAEIVDPVTVAKIERKVLKGFSWSARNARVTVDKAAKGGRIVDGQIYEVSVVDRPANPACQFTIAKADGDGELELVDAPEFVEVGKADGGCLTLNEVRDKLGQPRYDTVKAEDERITPTQFAAVLKALGKTPTAPVAAAGEQAGAETEKADAAEANAPDAAALERAVVRAATGSAAGDIEKRDFSQKERDAAANAGEALPDGSYPIKTKSDLDNAIQAFGRAKDKAKAKAHIIKRARALGATDMLPDEWGVSKAFDAVAALEKAMENLDGLDLSKVDAAAAAHENVDIADGKAAIACIARLIISEAEELAEGHLCEIDDIQMLTSAACALQCFIESEAHEVSSHMPPTGATTEEAPIVEAAKTDDAAATTAVDVIEKTDQPTEKTDDAPADGETLTKTDLTDLLESTIAKATQPYKDELDLVKAQLAKVLETPRTDGPARTRTTTHTAIATKADELRATIAHCQQQVRLTGGELQKGYRQRLDEAEAELHKLDGTAA